MTIAGRYEGLNPMADADADAAPRGRLERAHGQLQPDYHGVFLHSHTRSGHG